MKKRPRSLIVFRPGNSLKRTRKCCKTFRSVRSAKMRYAKLRLDRRGANAIRQTLNTIHKNIKRHSGNKSHRKKQTGGEEKEKMSDEEEEKMSDDESIIEELTKRANYKYYERFRNINIEKVKQDRQSTDKNKRILDYNEQSKVMELTKEDIRKVVMKSFQNDKNQQNVDRMTKENKNLQEKYDDYVAKNENQIFPTTSAINHGIARRPIDKKNKSRKNQKDLNDGNFGDFALYKEQGVPRLILLPKEPGWLNSKNGGNFADDDYNSQVWRLIRPDIEEIDNILALKSVKSLPSALSNEGLFPEAKNGKKLKQLGIYRITDPPKTRDFYKHPFDTIKSTKTSSPDPTNLES
jgi:hypothetical protein